MERASKAHSFIGIGNGGKDLTKKPRRPSPRDPRPWPRSQEGLHQGAKKAFTKGSKALAKKQEDLHQGIQGLSQGTKKTFTKGYKALAKEPRRQTLEIIQIFEFYDIIYRIYRPFGLVSYSNLKNSYLQVTSASRHRPLSKII